MDEEVVSTIDKLRGLVPRATYINEKMKEVVTLEGRSKHTSVTATPNETEDAA